MAKKTDTTKCSFCGRPADMAEVMVPSASSPNTYICSDCVEAIDDLLKEYRQESKASGDSTLTEMSSVPKPKEIYEFLNKYVIGQDDAKKISVCGGIQPLQASCSIVR